MNFDLEPEMYCNHYFATITYIEEYFHLKLLPIASRGKCKSFSIFWGLGHAFAAWPSFRSSMASSDDPEDWIRELIAYNRKAPTWE